MEFDREYTFQRIDGRTTPESDALYAMAMQSVAMAAVTGCLAVLPGERKRIAKVGYSKRQSEAMNKALDLCQELKFWEAEDLLEKKKLNEYCSITQTIWGATNGMDLLRGKEIGASRKPVAKKRKAAKSA